MPAEPNRVRDIFLAALECSPAERPGFLANACQGDADLRSEVDRLLVANADPDSILEPPSPTLAHAARASVPSHPETVDLPGRTSATAAFDQDAPTPTAMATGENEPKGVTPTYSGADPDATTPAELAVSAPRAARVPTGDWIGTVIAGRYTLLEVLGEGGMGTVYRAEQTQPVRRGVALKLIKIGMNSRAVLARFEAERQALALMDHPNIARVYDGGATEANQPFFVMELVNGVSITRYCDRHYLPVRARLELFVAVCKAVQHAHQKGIIHRDLKPSNVLVTEVDGRPTPKVIDFGVAKATEFDLTDQSLGDTGAIVGTPTYMSPEQADPSSTDIDTRTDVYALGVILYELLVGSPPIEAKQFKRGAVLEMLRMVREVDPPRPSTKVSTAEALPTIAASRDVEPAQLKRALTGDLDWIVMKALEKDRTRRYETANGFAADVLRHLANEPVVAAPPSRAYRLRKFVRKHRGAVIAVSLVLLSLLGGLTAVVVVQDVANARLVASLNRETKATRALHDANAQLTRSRAAVQERYDLAVDAIKTFHTGVSEDFLLKEERFKDLRNRLLKSASDFYGKLGALLGKETDRAARRALGQANFELAELTAKVGAPEDAFAAHRQVLLAREGVAAETPGDWELRTDVGRSLTAVAMLLESVGRTGEAEATYRKAEARLIELAATTGNSSAARTVLAYCRSRLGRLLQTTGRLDEALSVYRKARADQKALAAVPGATAEVQRDLTVTINGLANLLAATGKSSEAKTEYQTVLELRRKLVHDNPGIARYRIDLAGGYLNLGILLMHTSESSSAQAEFRNALALYQKLAEEIPAVTEFRIRLADSHHSLGWSMADAGNPAAAEAEYREALAIQQKLADDNPAVNEFRSRLADCHHHLGILLFASGKLSEAEAEHRSAMAIQQKLANDNSTVIEFRNRLALSHSRLGWLLSSLGKSSEALSEYRKGLALQQSLADDYPMMAGIQEELAFSLSEVGRHLALAGNTVAAIGYYRQEEAIGRKLAETGSRTPDIEDRLADCRTNMAELLRRSGKIDDALAACKNSLAVREQLVATHPEVPFYRANLGETYLRIGQVHRDMGNLRDAAAALRRGCEHFDAIRSLAGNSTFFQACCHAGLTGIGGRPDSGVSSTEGADHAEKAMSGLRRAVSLGYRDFNAYLTESALDPLRYRPDFRALMMDLAFPKRPFAE